MFKRTGLDKSNKNRAGVPDPKKFERTGKDTFVVHADGGNYFEGKVNNPNVQMKPSSKMIFANVGVCLRKCVNRSDATCKNCFRFSAFKGAENACIEVS